ncbi:hypothetical protein CVD28_03815 [Bacillus sp. M6-12]|uniref:hypothetical protein n=1 Tax=Bacillus sp. M6-12 TaxID=2054166 RepID=UPI000C75700E|nr:hypothetical protein [Bacillus sp. M6-12]PLS19554.1 hypothetical protein CVD28_03815 [Bacillus sp. M6-12]
MSKEIDKEIEKLLYIYKRALIILSKATEEDVRKHLSGRSYEEYVQGVAKKHLELAKPLEAKEEELDDLDIDKWIEQYERNK